MVVLQPIYELAPIEIPESIFELSLIITLDPIEISLSIVALLEIIAVLQIPCSILFISKSKSSFTTLKKEFLGSSTVIIDLLMCFETVSYTHLTLPTICSV